MARKQQYPVAALPLAPAQLLLTATLSLLSGCLGMPAQVQPVGDFDLNSYLGKWYEIARLDHSFERGLDQVTATYSLREDGGVSVINRGYSSDEPGWQEAEGRAYFVNSPDEGYLKVSFFGPFYGSYVIFELDSDYQYAFVTGPNTGYLWLLARQPMVDPDLIAHFQRSAQKLGFDTKKLIFPQQNR